MSEQQIPKMNLPDPQRVTEIMNKVSAQSQQLVSGFLERTMSGETASYQVLDPRVVGKSFMEAAQRMMSDPAKLMTAQAEYWQSYMSLWETSTRRMFGQQADPVAQPKPGDKRFKDDAWRDNPVFDFIKQSYLLAAEYTMNQARDVDGMDDKTAEKLEFYTRQFVDAMSPSNFAASNPQVVRKTLETGGENLLLGLSNMLDDLERGKGKLRVKMTAEEKFELGVNVGVTPCKVVYQTDLMQLLQFEPATDKVFKRPLLIVPPWINKYYIMDLRAKNSLIKWLVEQGHTVFLISWVNPDEKLAEKGFDDYMLEGPLAALDAIEKATGEKRVNAIGYCLGGSLLAATLAWQAAKGDNRIASGTFFTTMTDFSNPGELGVFIDEEQISLMETAMQKQGYFEGAKMAEAFNLLRANDLIWGFVINNYLMGQEPFPFDLLYWNSDSTRMPRKMHTFYIRNMYQRNLLCKPGGITLAGEPIDLTKVKVPTYMLSTREDHIAPWKSTYAATQLYSGPKRFVLGGSGHIAGVINPPTANKYQHWVGENLPADPEEWFAGTEERAGSWWTDWEAWVESLAKQQVAARQPGAGALPVLEDGPGSFVKARL